VTAEPIATTPLVTLEAIRRHLGWPRLELQPMLQAQAAEHDLQLDFHVDWAGRLCLSAAQAAELVARVEGAAAAAAAAQQRRNRASDLAAIDAQQRSEQRAQLAYRTALETFQDEGVALALAHQGYRQDISDEALTARFGAAAELWRAGYRTLAPEPVAATTQLQDQVLAEGDAAVINRTGQVSARALRRAADAGKRKFRP